MHMNIWQRNAENRKKKEKQGNVTNMTKQDTLQKITGQSKR